MEEVKPTATGSENATQEQGYLMAYDKKEQKAKGVKGIAANGELETLEANETNKSQFIRVDRHGNFFTNFGKNFMYQYNHPTRYALYRMEEKTPVEEAKRRIEQAQLPENESLRRELSRDNRIYNNHLFNEREINWQQAERYGLTPDVLRQTGDMERLLQGRQSGIAYDISMNTELGRQKGDAKLSLFRDENGLAKFDLHFIRQAPKVGQEYRGYKLEEDVLDNASYYGRIFARSGGLSDGVKEGLKEQSIDFEAKPCACDGIEECRMALLKKSRNALDANFIEGMACIGGCIGGAGCLTHGEKNKAEVDKYGMEAYEKTISEAVSVLMPVARRTDME